MSTILKNTNFCPAALLVTLGSCSSRLNIYKHSDICSREIQVQREIKGSQESQVCRETLVPLAGRVTRGWWVCQDHKEKSEPQGHKDLQETLAFQGPGWVINPAEIDSETISALQQYAQHHQMRIFISISASPGRVSFTGTDEAAHPGGAGKTAGWWGVLLVPFEIFVHLGSMRITLLDILR